MTVEEIKNKLKKKSILFSTGGFRHTNEKLESWIGKVGWQNKGEIHPIDKDGRKMVPLATFFLKGLPHIPENLKGIELITVFVSLGIFLDFDRENLSKHFEIRTYKDIENLEKCEYVSDELLPFPLAPKLVENDFPALGDMFGEDIYDEIRKKEKTEGIDYYEDICVGDENYMVHKIGGYPTTIQDGIGFSEGYEFVMQITSDEKAEFNIIHNGNFYFGFNAELEKWEVRCDFF